MTLSNKFVRVEKIGEHLSSIERKKKNTQIIACTFTRVPPNLFVSVPLPFYRCVCVCMQGKSIDHQRLMVKRAFKEWTVPSYSKYIALGIMLRAHVKTNKKNYYCWAIIFYSLPLFLYNIKLSIHKIHRKKKKLERFGCKKETAAAAEATTATAVTKTAQKAKAITHERLCA